MVVTAVVTAVRQVWDGNPVALHMHVLVAVVVLVLAVVRLVVVGLVQQMQLPEV